MPTQNRQVYNFVYFSLYTFRQIFLKYVCYTDGQGDRERWIGNNVEGSGHGIFQDTSGETKENQEETQWRYSMSPCQIPIRSLPNTKRDSKTPYDVRECCYHSDHLISKELKLKIYKTVILSVVLYGCKIWSLTLREEHRLRKFQKRVLRKIFGPKREEWHYGENCIMMNFIACITRYC